MDCSLYKTKYIDKTKKSFSNHLNNDRPDVSDPNAIPKCCYFAQNGIIFNTHLSSH